MEGATPPAAPAIVASATLGDADLAGLGPLTLRMGQRLLAEVLAVRAETDRMILSIAGRRLEAQVPAGVRQGEILRVVVSEVLPDRIVFRLDTAPLEGDVPIAAGPRAQGAASAAGQALTTPVAGTQPAAASSAARLAAAPLLDAARVLAELDVPDSPAARAVVQALVERRQPLTRESVQQLRAVISGAAAAAAQTDSPLPTAPAAAPSPSFPTTPGSATPGTPGTPVAPGASALELDARAAVRLREAGLPITARALQLARASLAPATSAPIGALLGELIATLRAAVPGREAQVARSGAAVTPDPAEQPDSPSPAAARALGLAASSPTARELERVVSLHTGSPEAALANEDALAPSAAPLPEDRGTRQNARTILLGLIDPSDDLAETSEPASAEAALRPPATPAADLTGAARVRALVTALHDRIELDQLRAAVAARADVTASAGTSLTAESLLIAQTEADPVTLAAGPLLAPTPAPTGPQLPAVPITLAVPLAFGGQLATLHLVVQRDTEGGGRDRADASPAVRASFTLHLRRLGEVGADLRLQGPLVRCRLRAASPEVAQRVSASIDSLRDRLQASGLDVRQLECIVAGAPDGETAGGFPVLELRHVAVEA